MAVTSRAGMYTQTQALSYWQVRWSGVAGHIDWAARKDERLDERVLFGEQHWLGKGSFRLCTWRETFLYECMGWKFLLLIGHNAKNKTIIHS